MGQKQSIGVCVCVCVRGSFCGVGHMEFASIKIAGFAFPQW